MLRVGINGFGRIGRLAFRLMIEQPEAFEIVGINDLTDVEMLVYLLKYDTTQGRLNHKIEIKGNNIVVNGREVKVTSERNPADIPWLELGTEVVLECTGLFSSKEKAEEHLKAGAKRVIISAPGSDDIKMIVYNTNHETLDGSETIISAASCTTNCLAPMAKVLNDNYGIQKGLMTTIHAYTNDQNTLDAPHPKGDFRRARSAANNIVPNSTGAAKAIGKVIPELEGKLDGSAQRVPVPTGSITELVCSLDKKVSVEEINKAMKEAENDSFGYNYEMLVSSDVIGIYYGSLFDATQTKVIDVNGEQLVKVVAWYDNEMSYTVQLIRLLVLVGGFVKEENPY
ncbi:type I glyceraldehyde-3-phosphate dehydrogenase [Metaclostridioides mangenotii]|uniref:Glyceraldehyde-3-phosphate dehydrogenase n=1 Tax=Metaclostridioides mangenotii TaxID=1540 RepID=A0ABS4EAR4_9FIRM|nr:type I glyceraldehyde-3-phosphate dehydrogenase [Clostridioides mangenotii]MBP1855032.1 glyceraldehyde 3-phosphate dehydrogenase [Clostridioides mangenotii]